MIWNFLHVYRKARKNNFLLATDVIDESKYIFTTTHYVQMKIKMNDVRKIKHTFVKIIQRNIHTSVCDMKFLQRWEWWLLTSSMRRCVIRRYSYFQLFEGACCLNLVCRRGETRVFEDGGSDFLWKLQTTRSRIPEDIRTSFDLPFSSFHYYSTFHKQPHTGLC